MIITTYSLIDRSFRLFHNSLFRTDIARSESIKIKGLYQRLFLEYSYKVLCEYGYPDCAKLEYICLINSVQSIAYFLVTGMSTRALTKKYM